MSDEVRSFLAPEVTYIDETGMSKIDREKSEEYRHFGAYRQPNVFYAIKANKYFKDPQSTKEFNEDELRDLGLPLPIEIEAARKRLIKASIDKGEVPKLIDIQRATAPKGINPPDYINQRLNSSQSQDERFIARINKSIK